MAKIYRRSDRIAVRVDDITVHISPLSFHQKTEIQQAMFNGIKGETKDRLVGIVKSLKYALKGIEGVENTDGEPYKLEFNGEELTDSCVDDLMNLEITNKLIMVCAAMINGVPSGFTDERGDKIDGVELISAKSAKESISKNV